VLSGDQEFTQSDDDATLRALRHSEVRFRTLAASTPTAIFECDLTGEVLYANERWCDMLGAGLPTDTALVDRLHPEDLKWLAELWRNDVTSAEPKGFEARCRMVQPRGQWCWFDVSLRPMFDEHGKIRSYLGAVHDVTELVEARQRSQRFQSIVEATSDLVAIVRDDFDIQYLNPAGRDAVGLGPDDDPTSVDPADHFLDDEWPRVVDEASRLLAEQDLWNGETSFRRADGTDTILSHVIVRGSDDDGTKWYASLARDISAAKVHHYGSADDAQRDVLTGLMNRDAILTELRSDLERTAGTGRVVGLMCIDVDQFKLVNDSFGHEAGDELLLELTGRLVRSAGASARLARFGSDEFVVLLEGMPSASAVHRRAAYILSALTGRAQLTAGAVHVSVSVGVITDDGTATASELLRDADATVSLAKSRGRGRLEVFDHRVHSQVVSRLATEMELRQGLEEHQFVLHYQPVIDLKRGGLSAVEALVRWEHPRYGLLGPDKFLPVVEECGLARPLGSWVLETACAASSTWDRPTPGRPRLAVNISADQLNAADFVDEVQHVVERTGLGGHALVLEVTEGIVMADAASAASTLSSLRALGAQIAIDDFGTGYSSLSHLTRLPVDVLKVDKSFVQALGSGANDDEVTATVVGLGHSLGLRVVAEGVETDAQLRAVRELGCEAVQGYFFSTPVSAEEIAELTADTSWIDNRRSRP
jgi:diguanylate cyclase (GGDEF)-like protein/PAS domain S-box-containing protein